ncbi:glycoside hydrolase family 88 protein [Pseudoduganella eburnea]|uniref:Glycoside hydrolase family 88 protein n=1 Tax=Massilia eburnea TaxID=1776165 RepID=A0A6L6QHF1_9BURK|nr:glycoside hydrolase family 88 protein [Massilia eburnea]MTW11096.1 glycoside hydrolase family 88 protein [Massilia eburnea]
MPIQRIKRVPLALLCASLCFSGSAIVAALPANAATPAVSSAQVLAPSVVLETMEKVADWQLENPTGYPLDDWTEGVGDAGFMALSGISANPKYREAMRAAGEKLQWRLGPSKFHADDHVVGQMYSELYLQLRDPRMIAKLRAQFDEMLAEPRPGSLNWLVPDVLHRWGWCDSLFMGPGAWARLTAATGDQRYLDYALKTWWQTSDYLYDKEEHLYFRDSRYFDKKEENGKKVFWGRGNGWVLAGLARMLQYIPDNRPERERFLQQYREMSERLAGLQQADGLWRASLLDPDSYKSAETSGTGLYAYALAWGVNQGILPRDKYAPAVKRAWQALNASVQANSKLINVQPIGADPKHFDPQSSDVFAVGAFLLAGAEMYRMGLEEAGAVRVLTVQNDGAAARLDTPVDVADVGDMAVMDALTTRLLPTVLAGKDLEFRTDIAAGETRRYLLIPRSRLPAGGKGAGLARASLPLKVSLSR